jgi:murein DD-endopeptidase MepM/ murein hydrolase activator NlpD
VAFVGLVAGVPVVTVAHADGRRTTYQPVEATVRRGQWVEAGEQIGRLGAISGHCRPAACLHWGLLRGSDYLDPLLLVTPVTVRLLRLDDPPTRDTGT